MEEKMRKKVFKVKCPGQILFGDPLDFIKNVEPAAEIC